MMLRASHTAARVAVALAVATVGCRSKAPDEAEGGPAESSSKAEPSAEASAPPPSEPAPEHDAPDLQSALTAAIHWGVVAPDEGGSTWEVDPFVVAWIVAAVQANGDRWLTPYEESGSDGVEVAGWQVRVPADSPLKALGLQDGDVVERVAEVPATDVAAVQTAVANADNQIRLTIHRKEFSMTLAYRLETELGWSRMQADLGGDAPPPRRGDEFVALDPSVLPSRFGPPGAALTRRAANPSSGAGSPGKPPSSSKPSSSSEPSSSKPSPGKPSPGKPSSSSKPSSSGAEHVRCSGSTCVVDRAYFDQMVGSPSRLQSQATIVPAIHNDVHSGYKLESVKSGSAVAAMGFRSGDKITHVNGYDLTNDAEALSLYFGLGSTKTFKVRYIRGGTARTKTIRVQ